MDSGMIMSKDSHSLKVKCCIVSIALAAVPAWGADVQSGIDDFNPDISPYSYVWETLGEPVRVGGGLYQFTDPAATSHARRFYQLRSP